DLEYLEQPRGSHAAADAHRDDHVPGATALALDEGMAGHPGAGHAIRMADRDRAAIDVEQLVRNAELIPAIDYLDGEGLVQLPEADVAHLQAEPVEQLRHCEDRADTHLVRLGAGDGHADIAAERGQALLRG